MKWVKRCLWVAAWGCWVWLGIRLSLELPRESGPAVGTRALSVGEFQEAPNQPMMFNIAFREGVNPTWHSYEQLIDSDAHGLLIEEQWDELWRAWLPAVKYKTYAWRFLDEFSLKYRTVGSFTVLPRNMNADKSRFVLRDGSLYRFPLAPNYPLLALCQAILALPLLLTWLALRWRQKRRLRVAGAAS